MDQKQIIFSVSDMDKIGKFSIVPPSGGRSFKQRLTCCFALERGSHQRRGMWTQHEGLRMKESKGRNTQEGSVSFTECYTMSLFLLFFID